MKVLITGVCSEIGCILAAYLLEHGHRVVGLDVAALSNAPPGLEFVRSDVRDGAVVCSAGRNCDSGIHLASLAGESSAEDILSVNVAGAYSFLSAAAVNGFSNAIVASSAPVHLPPELWSATGRLPTSAGKDHAYDLSKSLQEHTAHDFHARGAPIMVLRFGHVVRGEQAVNADDGTPLSEFEYCRGGWVALEDVVRVCARALQSKPAADALEVLNVVGSAGARQSFNIAAVERRLNLSLDFDFADYE